MHVAAYKALAGFEEPRPAYLWPMRTMLLMGNWGEGLAILCVGALLLTLVPFIVLVGGLWSQRIDQQLDREWNEQKEQAAARARAGQWRKLLAWLFLSVVGWKALFAWVG